MHCLFILMVDRSGIMLEEDMDNNANYLLQPNFPVPAISYIVSFHVRWVCHPHDYCEYNEEYGYGGPSISINVEKYTYVSRQGRGKNRDKIVHFKRRQENKSTTVYYAEPGDWFWTKSNSSYRV